MIKEFWWQYIIYAIVCYLLCNFNFAVFISKKFKHRDIRNMGSGNPGTTNMFRAFGLKVGILTFICDALKGAICSLGGILLFKALAGGFTSSPSNEIMNVALFGGYIGGFFAGLGHVFPAFYHFKGGKGFATGVGVFLVLSPLCAILSLILGFVLLLFIDRMSIFALLFFTIITLESAITLLPSRWYLFALTAMYYVLVIFAHRSNIKRLYLGTENPMGISNIFKKKG
ncbi:MAG: glycerol-3-phosphate acyltransferase [Clostridia bacterium]